MMTTTKVIRLLAMYSRYSHTADGLMFLYLDEDSMIRIIDLQRMEETEVIGTDKIYCETDFLAHVGSWIKSYGPEAIALENESMYLNRSNI